MWPFRSVELRVGHTNKIWSTAQGRFGHPTRVNGVQHPAPPLKCLVDRTPDGISVTAQYALALFNGRNVTSKPPKTEIWCMLYAQVKQADAAQNRNILLSEARAQFVESEQFNLATFLAERSRLTSLQTALMCISTAQPRESPAGRRATSSNYWINPTWLTPPA